MTLHSVDYSIAMFFALQQILSGVINLTCSQNYLMTDNLNFKRRELNQGNLSVTGGSLKPQFANFRAQEDMNDE